MGASFLSLASEQLRFKLRTDVCSLYPQDYFLENHHYAALTRWQLNPDELALQKDTSAVLEVVGVEPNDQSRLQTITNSFLSKQMFGVVDFSAGVRLVFLPTHSELYIAINRGVKPPINKMGALLFWEVQQAAEPASPLHMEDWDSCNAPAATQQSTGGNKQSCQRDADPWDAPFTVNPSLKQVPPPPPPPRRSSTTSGTGGWDEVAIGGAPAPSQSSRPSAARRSMRYLVPVITISLSVPPDPAVPGATRVPLRRPWSVGGHSRGHG